MAVVLTAGEMRAADARAVRRSGATTLMQTAGEQIAQTILARGFDCELVVAFAGPGNNGGDAFAACATLKERGMASECIVIADDGPRSEAAQAAQARAQAAGVGTQPLSQSATFAQRASLILDGIFGTGARLPVNPPYDACVRAMNGADAPVISIDIPTGIDADSGALSEPCVRAQLTVALAALKPGLLLDPARDYAGEVVCVDIGIDAATLQAHAQSFAALDTPEFLALLPPRANNADKRAAGAPFIIAGSQQFPGAAVLCARGAARAGAGYVTVATPAAAAASLRSHLIEQVVVEISATASVDEVVEGLLETASHCSAVGIGPGLGLDERTGEIVRTFLRRTTLPFVADASALFHFAKHLDVIDIPRAVITPHAGEFARLSGKGTFKEGERVERLREFVKRAHCVTLLKGRATLIDDGTLVHINTTGTPALATAGTGDVLTGMIATLLSQGLRPVDAARAAAFWHGAAGAFCARERAVGVIAGDLPDALAATVASLRS